MKPASGLFQRIDLTAICGNVHHISGQDGSSLDCPAQPGSPDHAAGRDIDRVDSASLNANHPVADDRRRSDHITDPNLPTQPAALDLERIEETVLAANESEIAGDCRRGGN